METDADRQVGQQVFHCIAESVALQHCLLKLLVHEVVLVPVVVQELHLHLVDDDPLNGVGGAEALNKHCAGAYIAKLRLDKRAEVARRAVLHREHQVKVVLEFDDHARAHLRCGNRHKNP